MINAQIMQGKPPDECMNGAGKPSDQCMNDAGQFF